MLADAFGDEKTRFTDSRSQAEHQKPAGPDLVFELDHLEDILRTMAESLRAEQEERMTTEESESFRSGDTDQNQPPAAGWSVGCILM